MRLLNWLVAMWCSIDLARCEQLSQATSQCVLQEVMQVFQDELAFLGENVQFICVFRFEASRSRITLSGMRCVHVTLWTERTMKDIKPKSSGRTSRARRISAASRPMQQQTGEAKQLIDFDWDIPDEALLEKECCQIPMCQSDPLTPRARAAGDSFAGYSI